MPEPIVLHRAVRGWYDAHARDLPWRRPEASPWGVLVSEIMLQQTPVARVLPVYDTWLTTWATPAELAAAPAGEAVRAWGRLGYPRRALRLHAAARAIVDEHAGEVPSSLEALRRLPGVGEYTAAAVASFAFGQRHAVLDTNVRRVVARVAFGSELAAPALTNAERRLAESWLPRTDAATWAVGLMELGALVCTAARPACERCPLTTWCAWRAAGYQAYDGPSRRVQTYSGTDRQCRGRLLGVVRDSDGPVHANRLDSRWADVPQRERCLSSLLDDGLIELVAPHTYALPR